MRTKRLFKSIGVAMSLMCLGFLITACGGGGGSGSSSDSPTAPSGTGSVAVLITDGPSAEMNELSLEISRISLIPAGNGEAVVIYDDPKPDKINVLKFKSKEEPYFLTLEENVPAGYYAKIRLEIDNIVVVGGSCAGDNIKLPSGKKDLNPRGGLSRTGLPVARAAVERLLRATPPAFGTPHAAAVVLRCGGRRGQAHSGVEWLLAGG